MFGQAGIKFRELLNWQGAWHSKRRWISYIDNKRDTSQTSMWKYVFACY